MLVFLIHCHVLSLLGSIVYGNMYLLLSLANSSFCAIQFPVETDKSDVHSVKNNILNQRKRKNGRINIFMTKSS